MLELEPRTGPRLDVALSNGRVKGRETLAAIVRRTDAVAAVNGGFFASAGLSNGDPVGALVSHGRLVSESVDGRPALVVYRDRTRRAKVARLSFSGRLRVGERRRRLDGVNRPAGFIPGCGGRGGDRPTEEPNSAVMCTDPSELVLMTRDFGRRTPKQPGAVEAVIRNGAVTAIEADGGTPLARGSRVLTGTGSAARFLRRRLEVGTEVKLRAVLKRGRRALGLSEVRSVVSGDPLLLRRGQTPAIGPSPSRARTLVGLKSDGKILLVTVDAPGRTLRGSAALMRDLGARDAMALDGGGSTTLAIGDRIANSPSGGAPRELSDALVLVR